MDLGFYLLVFTVLDAGLCALGDIYIQIVLYCILFLFFQYPAWLFTLIIGVYRNLRILEAIGPIFSC